VLTLKLFLVPAFLLLVSLAGKRWGPSVAGWLAGLPVVAGPILFFLAVERGDAFASSAAASALSAVVASVAFSVTYSHAAQRMSWAPSLLLALPAWGAAAFVLSLLPSNISLSLLLALITLMAAPRLFPAAHALPTTYVVSTIELCCRMLAGAVLVVVVTVAAERLGSNWSGLLAVFPVLGIVLAVFSHRTQGSVFVAALLRAMATGLYSFASFCFALSLALPYTGIPAAFAMAVALAVAVQVATKRHLTRRSSGAAQPA
jgi:uncharacterized membrane protein (GlpM family)